MFVTLVFAALLLWFIAGGAFQILTGRDAGIASFRRSNFDPPSPRVVRISGVAALVVGLLLVPVWIGWITGSFSH